MRIYLYTTYDLYLTASVVWLLLQTGAPILPTRLRNFLSSRQLVVIEAVIQVLIPLLSLTNDIPLFMDYVAYHHYLDMGCRSLPTLSFLVLCVVLGCCVLVLCFTSAILGFFLVRFIKSAFTIRRTKKLIFKLTFLCISTITYLHACNLHSLIMHIAVFGPSFCPNQLLYNIICGSSVCNLHLAQITVVLSGLVCSTYYTFWSAVAGLQGLCPEGSQAPEGKAL